MVLFAEARAGAELVEEYQIVEWEACEPVVAFHRVWDRAQVHHMVQMEEELASWRQVVVAEGDPLRILLRCR